MKKISSRFVNTVSILVYSVASAPEAQANPQFFMVNGGRTPEYNVPRYNDQIRMMENATRGWESSSFVSDGPRSTAVNSRRVTSGSDRVYDRHHHVVLTNLRAPASTQGPATVAAIEQGFRERVARLRPGEPLGIYITGHGEEGAGPNNRTVVLWNNQQMPMETWRRLLQTVPASNPIIMLNEQCFGGGMLDALRTSDGHFRPQSCGFSAGTAQEVTWGSPHFAGTLQEIMQERPSASQQNAVTFEHVYERLNSSEVLQSSPQRTSDQFLREFLGRQEPSWAAGAAEVDLTNCFTLPSGALSPAVRQSIGHITEAMLLRRAERMRTDVLRLSKALNLGSHPSPRNIESQYAAAVQNLDGAVMRAHEAQAQYRDLQLRWLNATEPSLMNEHRQSLQDIERFQAAGDVAQLQAAQRRFQLADERLSPMLLNSGISTPLRSRFISWCQSHQPPLPYEIAKKQLRENLNAQYAAMSEMTGLRRLRDSLTSYLGLQAMVRGPQVSESAMVEYAGILQCEQTPVQFSSSR